jgi:2,4-dienoyl-CoA reductase-like NADH-dependent reductase (Old Yellow Enzyme family)
MAETIRRESGLPVIAVGLITEPEMADTLVRQGKADLVGVARAMVYNPRWPMHAAARLGAEIHIPRQAFRCQPEAVQPLFRLTDS